MPVVKPGRDRVRDELDQPPQAEESHGEEEHAGHSTRHQQACQPVPDEDGERMTMNAAVGP